MMVVAPGEQYRYLEETLKNVRPLVDSGVICINGLDEELQELIEGYGFKWYIDNHEWGKHQWKIKETLAEVLSTENPDWVLAVDSDEVFAPNVTRETLRELARKGHHAWYVHIINHWNDPEHHKLGMNFWNVRFWRYIPELLQWERKPVHCGLAPRWAYQHGKYAPVILRHFGLMDPKDRQKKVDRYDKYDAKAQYKGRQWYDMLKSKQAPEAFDVQEWTKKVEDEVATYKQDKVTPLKTLMSAKDTRFRYYRRLVDGEVLDIPERHWPSMDASSEFELVTDDVVERDVSVPEPTGDLSEKDLEVKKPKAKAKAKRKPRAKKAKSK